MGAVAPGQSVWATVVIGLLTWSALLLSGCGNADPRSEPGADASAASPTADGGRVAEYDGISLPQPDPIDDPDLDVVLPPAWVIVEGRAVAGTHGSYTYVTGATPCPEAERGGCIRMTHADAPAPEDRSEVATIEVSAAERPVLVVASPSVGKFEATLQDWSDGMTVFGPKAVWAKPKSAVGDDVTVYPLQPLGAEREDQLLSVALAFPENYEVTYFWRLVPVGD